MSKIYELLVETAKQAERETGGATSYCTLQVFANGAVFAGGVKGQLAGGADEGELVARLSERLANNEQATQPYKAESLITNWKDGAKPEIKEFATETAAIGYCDRVSEMSCFVYARVTDANDEEIYEVVSSDDGNDGMDTNEAKANGFHAMY